MNNPLKDKNGEISRYTSIKVNIAAAFTIVISLIGTTIAITTTINNLENQISHIIRTQEEYRETFNTILNDKKVSIDDFKRPDALFYCRELAQANRKNYPDLVCPDPYRIPKWSPTNG